MHIIVWEIVARPDRVGEFVSAYEANGDWAQPFSLAAGYRGTELLSATDNPERFITIDRWASIDDYSLFQERFGAQYRFLDAQLEGLTVSETKLGTFSA